MNTALWIAQGLLAFIMLAAGAMKLSQPKDKLHASGMEWVDDRTDGQVKAIGALEVLAAIGLILPAVLDIAPILVPITAVAVVVLMIGAAITHLGRGEGKSVPVNVVIAAIAIFIAVFRFGSEAF